MFVELYSKAQVEAFTAPLPESYILLHNVNKVVSNIYD